jgi:hypothetical protein
MRQWKIIQIEKPAFLILPYQNEAKLKFLVYFLQFLILILIKQKSANWMIYFKIPPECFYSITTISLLFFKECFNYCVCFGSWPSHKGKSMRLQTQNAHPIMQARALLVPVINHSVKAKESTNIISSIFLQMSVTISGTHGRLFLDNCAFLF